jgi:hypothetical protein
MNVPNDFVRDYEASIHYEEGDKVVDIEAGVHSMGFSYMDLVVQSKDGKRFSVPFYFNQMPYECNEGEMSEADWIENDAEAWVESMAGATVWTEWFNDAEIFEI